ncbi:hypothetical protein ABZ079_13180 [Streptomyces sp. NPDC006314]|uniref:WD40 repeat domain-containing protein n=1 Tax=Streptomyces sp. NPDC006314 TaxID=3154475 RepID=UPI0033BA0673
MGPERGHDDAHRLRLPGRHRAHPGHRHRLGGPLSGRWTAQGEVSDVPCLRRHPFGRRLVTGSRDRTIRLWDADGTGLAVPAGHEDRVQDVADALLTGTAHTTEPRTLRPCPAPRPTTAGDRFPRADRMRVPRPLPMEVERRPQT